MNLIKNSMLVLFSVLISLSLLVVGDWIILRTINEETKENLINPEATKIESKRVEMEDHPQKKLAIQKGYLPSIYPIMMRYTKVDYPLIAGLPNTDTYLCNEGYGLVKYRSDRFGFRNDDRDWDKPIKKIVIGDSFVHGACVSDEHVLSENIAKLSNSTVLNLGMSGNFPSHYLAYGELFVPKLLPSDIYLVFYPNDNAIRDPSVIETFYIDEGHQFFSNSKLELFDTELFYETGLAVISDLTETRDPMIQFFKKVYRAFSRHVNLPTIRGLLASKANNFDYTERAIFTFERLCRVHKCDITIVFIPNSHFYRPDPRADQYGDEIAELASKLKINFVDGRRVIDRSKGSKHFALKGPHLSPFGYKKLAEFIIGSPYE